MSNSRVQRVSFAAVMAATMAANTSSQFLFGVLGPFLRQEFDVPRSALGALTTIAFLVGAAASPMTGRLADLGGGRRVLIASLTVMAAALVGMATAPSLGWLMAAAGVSGFALAASNPTTNKLIARHVPPGRRGIVTGVKQAGVQAGAFVIGIALPSLATAFGWRVAVAAAALLPVGTGVAALAAVPADPHASGGPASAGRVPRGIVVPLAAYAFCMGAGVAVIGTYLPLYATEATAMSARAAGALAATIGLTGIVSRIAWGWAAERAGTIATPLAVMALAAAAAAVGLTAAASTGPWLLWCVAVVFGTSAVTWNAVGMLAIITGIDSASAGRASGTVLAGFYLGFVASPIAFGKSVDATGTYAYAWTGTGVVFALAALVAIVWRRRRRV